MAENKTVPTGEDVDTFLEAVAHRTRRFDAMRIKTMMAEITGEPARMWGASIVGFGEYRYRHANGSENRSFLTGFSPRAQNLVIYVMPGFESYGDQLERLGEHRTGRSCLYINRLAAIDETVLEDIVRDSVTRMRQLYPE